MGALPRRGVHAPLAAVLTLLAVVASGVPATASADRSGFSADVPSGFSADVPSDELVVRWAERTDETRRAAARRDAEAVRLGQLAVDDTELVRLGRGQDLRQVGRRLVETGLATHAEPNVRFHRLVTDDPHFPELYGLRNTGQRVNGRAGTPGVDVRAVDAWRITRGRSSTVVAVIDTGVDLRHPDLAPNLWRNPREVAGTGRDDDRNGYPDDVHGWDFVRNAPLSTTAGREAAHGTHVAGTVAAVADNGIGVAGVAPGARLMILRVLEADGTGDLASIVDAIGYATENGARIANLSLGGPHNSRLLQDVMRGSGLAFVVAAGNDGADNDVFPMYPAAYVMPNLLGVTAVDNAGRLPGWANFGRRSVQVGAPGQDILSTVPGGYAFMSGTSMAAPHAAGVLALAASAAREADASTLIAATTSSAAPLRSLTGRTVTGGMVDAAGALAHLPTGTGAGTSGPGPGPGDGSSACPAMSSSPFTDVIGTAHETAIACASSRGLLAGHADGSFRPAHQVTRAQVATFTYRLLREVGQEPAPGHVRFADVAGVHEPAIHALASLGILQGADASRYDPDRTVSRAQMASILVRVHEEIAGAALPDARHPFEDVVGTTHEAAIARAWRAGLVNGTGDDRYDPHGPVRRGQMASFLVRLLEATDRTAVSS
jgi:subtilisin family serine protease